MTKHSGLAASLICSLLVAGCNETIATLQPAPQVSGPAAPAAASLPPKPGVSPAGASVAFVSLSGAPEAATAAFSAGLNRALTARGVTVAPAGQAHYLIRGHLSAQPAEGGGVEVAYVWDIYGADRQRRHRLDDELADRQARGEPWQAASGQLLPALASRGAADLAAWLTYTPEANASASAPAVAPAVAPPLAPAGTGAAAAPMAYAPLR